LIAGIFDKLGEQATVTVQDGKTLQTEVEYVEGLRWDRGYTSPYFVTNSKTAKVEYDNPMLLLVEKKITSLQEILKFLEHANKEGKALIIVAEDMDSEPLAALVINKLRGGLKVCFVKAPGFGDNRKNTMQDIAISTGATLISEEIGNSLENSNLESLGYAKKIIVEKDDTIIMGGMGAEEDVKERISQLEGSIELTTSEYDREKLQERLGKLTGGVAVIKVGGASEVEVGELKDRIDDALCSTRAA